MLDAGARQFTRRRLLTVAAAGACSLALGRSAVAASTGIMIKAPYMHQGGSGANEAVNCGPTTVAMAVNYSGAAAPSPYSVRATLGMAEQSATYSPLTPCTAPRALVTASAFRAGPIAQVPAAWK